VSEEALRKALRELADAIDAEAEDPGRVPPALERARAALAAPPVAPQEPEPGTLAAMGQWAFDFARKLGQSEFSSESPCAYIERVYTTPAAPVRDEDYARLVDAHKTLVGELRRAEARLAELDTAPAAPVPRCAQCGNTLWCSEDPNHDIAAPRAQPVAQPEDK
jgi:hypothetical protein